MSVSAYTERCIHYVTMLRLGMRLDYDDFSMQELRDIELTYLLLKRKEEESRFKTLFTFLSELVKSVMKAFRK